VVGTDTVACVAIDACAKRLDFTSLQVYLETFDVWGLTIVSEKVSDVFFLVAVDACYLLVPILVSEQWLRYASVEGNQARLIVLVSQLVNHHQDLAKFGENVEVVTRHYVRINQGQSAREQRLGDASIAGHRKQAKSAAQVREKIDPVTLDLRFKQ
jgi:hypothetical protein